MENEKCNWVQGFDGRWIVGCLGRSVFRMIAEARPTAFNFCPFCGKPIEAKEFKLK